MQTIDPLKVVDAGDSQWLPHALAVAGTKRNFVVVLSQREELDQLCEALGCKRDPERLERWGLHALADVLTAPDYTRLLSFYESKDIRLIEQLRLRTNSPPRVKPFILYCEVRGIISEHDSLEEAGNSLLDYLDCFKRARLFPLAGIYRFDGDRWERVRRLA